MLAQAVNGWMDKLLNAPQEVHCSHSHLHKVSHKVKQHQEREETRQIKSWFQSDVFHFITLRSLCISKDKQAKSLVFAASLNM